MVTDSRAPGRAIWAHNGVIYVEADLAALGIKSKRYITAPVRSIMPQPIDLSPVQIAPSLDRHWRECSPPSAIEAVYIDYFFSSTGINLSGRYTICGRTSYTAFGNELIHADDVYLADPFKIPSAEDAVDVSDLGESGSVMLKDLTTDFGGHS